MSHGTQQAEYCCPGESYPISRAVHLGRLAEFHPACRQCPRRDDTGTLSARQIRRLAETRWRGQPRSLFCDEGVCGVCTHDLQPAAARELAIALAVYLQHRSAPAAEAPAVVVGGDGRPAAAELVAAVSEGLRWAGCHVVEVGAVTAPCLAFAVDHLQTSGGVLVGNPHGRAHTAGLKFWAHGPRPLSAGGALDEVERIFWRRTAATDRCQAACLRPPQLEGSLSGGIDRPTRSYGSRRRLQAEEPYLAGLAEHYHALRPLRFVFDTSCRPVARYLAKLTAAVACQVLPCRTTPARLADQIVAEGAHFGTGIEDDGETCRLLDQRGRAVPAERLLLLLARHCLVEHPEAAIALEAGTPPAVALAIGSLGGRVVTAAPRRSGMEQTMRQQGAVLGGGPGARFWHAAGHASADALRTLTLLLVLLSRSDRPLSEVLDAEAPLG